MDSSVITRMFELLFSNTSSSLFTRRRELMNFQQNSVQVLYMLLKAKQVTKMGTTGYIYWKISSSPVSDYYARTSEGFRLFDVCLIIQIMVYEISIYYYRIPLPV